MSDSLTACPLQFVYVHSDDSDSGAESFSEDDLDDGLLEMVAEQAAEENEEEARELDLLRADSDGSAGSSSAAGEAAPAADLPPPAPTSLLGALRRRLAPSSGAPAAAPQRLRAAGTRGGAGSAAAPRSSTTARRAKRKKEGRKAKYRRAIDTNVLSLSLGRLAEEVEPATGDPVFCKECGAALSNISSVISKADGKRLRNPADEAGLAEDAKASEESAGGAGGAAAPEGKGEEGDDSEQLWTCEFCGAANGVTLDAEELPVSGSVDYVLEPPPSADLARSRTGDDNIIIFCIDTSGSMCVTQEVEGSVKLKGDHKAKDIAGLSAGEGEQFMPGQRRDVTYISRLQCVQAAVSTQIEQLVKAYPQRRVGVVTFNSDVTIVGDGTGEPRTLAGDRLLDEAALTAAGEGYALDGCVKDTGAALSEKVFALEETGPTALGPAVVVATAMAGRAAGSKVVVCTDGLANVGLGAIDELDSKSEADAAAITGFYSRIGEAAAAKGVSIDVIGIEGEGCDLETIGQMAEAAGGSVEKVSPLELTRNFGSVLANPIVATNVSVTLMLHKGLRFKDVADESERSGSAVNKVVRDIGNVTEESAVTFEYGMRSKSELAAAGIDIKALKSLPFQVQIRFTKLDGMKGVRVLSQSKKTTVERAQAEAAIDTPVLSAHAAQVSASLARKGDYDMARVNARAWSNMMQRGAKTESQRNALADYAVEMDEMDAAISAAVADERTMGLALSSSVPGAAGGAPAAAEEAASTRRKMRSKQDGLSKALYKAKKRGVRRR